MLPSQPSELCQNHPSRDVRIITSGSIRWPPSRAVHSSAARNKAECSTYSFPPTRCDESEHAWPVSVHPPALHVLLPILEKMSFLYLLEKTWGRIFVFIEHIFHIWLHLLVRQRKKLCKVADSLKLLTRPLGTAWMIYGYLKVTLFSQFTFLSQRVFRTMLACRRLKISICELRVTLQSKASLTEKGQNYA